MKVPKRRPPPVAVDLLVEAGDWPPEPVLAALSAKVVGAAVDSIGPRLAVGSELSLVFTDDAHIRRLNHSFRKKDSPTNVLSFPAPAGAGGRLGPLLGDVVLAAETVLREAKAEGLTIEAHLAHLILHGFLHILGYDHVEEADAMTMERLETAILGGLGIKDPYAVPPLRGTKSGLKRDNERLRKPK